MADVRWIKIYTDMISNKKIKRIRKMPEGNNIVLIWVFLLAQAGECNKSGALYLTDTIPFRAEDLAIEFDFEVSVINFALLTLEKFSMIEIFDEIICIKNWNEYQNIEGMDKIREQTRLRNKKYREKQKQLLLNDVTVTSRDETELELELEKEIIYIPEFDDVKNIYEHWNNAGIVKHRELTKAMRGKINARLEKYTADELKEAIDNYSGILKSENHFFTYKWSLVDFFTPDNISQFMNENDPWNNFIDKQKLKRQQRAVNHLQLVETSPEESERLARAFQQQRELNAANH